MLSELDLVVLTEDLPEEHLKAGDVGTIVHVHQNGAAFIVEFMTLAGQTIAVTTVEASQVRAVASSDVSHARSMETPA